MSVQRDPELEELFAGDPDLRELAHSLRATPHPAAHVDPTPHFRVALRRRLMREAWEQSSKPATPWYRRLLLPQPLALSGAAIAALLIVFTAFTFANSKLGSGPPSVRPVVPEGQPVAAIQLAFSQPMDARSVQQAISIQAPDGSLVRGVQYSWQDNNTRLTITQLAQNTTYQVVVSQTAKSQSGQALAKASPITISTGPASPPPTSPSPSPSPQIGPLTNMHPLGPLGAPGIVGWAADGSKVYVIGPNGQLQAWPPQGGAATTLQPDGVSLAAVSSDGTLAYVRNGDLFVGAQSVTGVQPIALGFRSGALLFVTASDVETARQRHLVNLGEAATAAEFSPLGDKVAYLGASGLHLVDLTTKKDSLVGPASGLGDWSPDNRHYAYLSDGGLWVVDASSLGSPVKAASLTGITSASWSLGNQLLLATSSALYDLTYGDSSAPRRLQAGEFAQLEWGPSGGWFAFRRAGQAWVAKLVGALPGTITPVTPGVSQDDVVIGFLTARQNQLTDQVLSFLDSAGKDAFTKLSFVYPDPSASQNRFSVLLAQPGRVVVRLVVTRGSVSTAVDETLTIQVDPAGRPWIHGVTDSALPSYGTGPEVRQVVVAANQVQVYFDSDLNPGTVQTGVTIKGVTTQAAYDSTQHLVTLTVPGGLTAGTTYDLVVSSALQDADQRPAVPYDLQFTAT